MNRNGHRIVSRRGRKYKLNRDKWTTYGNFESMHVHILDKLVHGNIAVEYPEPVWKKKDRKVVEEEEEAFGCKVTHNIVHPEWCIVGDETGMNLSMKGDRGSEKLLVARGDQPREKASSNDCHATVIGLTLLTGAPLMCIVVMKGCNPKPDVELGLDPFAIIFGKETDNFF